MFHYRHLTDRCCPSGGPEIISHKNATLAFFDGHKYNCADFPGQHDILCQRSTNQGRSWSNCAGHSSPVLVDAGVLGGPNCSGASTMCALGGAAPVVDMIANKIIVLFGLDRNEATRGEMWSVATTDLGLTFSAPRQHTGTDVSPAGWRVTAPTNAGVQEEDGSLLVPGYHANASQGEAQHTYISTDHGGHWKVLGVGGRPTEYGIGTAEGAIVRQARPGHLLAAARIDESLAHCVGPHSAADATSNVTTCRRLAESTDGGRSFGNYRDLAAIPSDREPFLRLAIVLLGFCSLGCCAQRQWLQRWTDTLGCWTRDHCHIPRQWWVSRRL